MKQHAAIKRMNGKRLAILSPAIQTESHLITVARSGGSSRSQDHRTPAYSIIHSAKSRNSMFAHLHFVCSKKRRKSLDETYIMRDLCSQCNNTELDELPRRLFKDSFTLFNDSLCAPDMATSTVCSVCFSVRPPMEPHTKRHWQHGAERSWFVGSLQSEASWLAAAGPGRRSSHFTAALFVK